MAWRAPERRTIAREAPARRLCGYRRHRRRGRQRARRAPEACWRSAGSWRMARLTRQNQGSGRRRASGRRAGAAWSFRTQRDTSWSRSIPAVSPQAATAPSRASTPRRSAPSAGPGRARRSCACRTPALAPTGASWSSSTDTPDARREPMGGALAPGGVRITGGRAAATGCAHPRRGAAPCSEIRASGGQHDPAGWGRKRRIPHRGRRQPVVRAGSGPSASGRDVTPPSSASSNHRSCQTTAGR
jgi:hypothetical protein